MDSTQANTKDNIHTHNLQMNKVAKERMIDRRAAGAPPPSFVRRYRQRTSRERINLQDHLHDAQTTNEKDGHDDDLPSESLFQDLLDDYSGLLSDGSGSVERHSVGSPSFVRCDRPRRSRERINLQVGGKITRPTVPGQKKVVVRPRTSIVQPNAKDHSILVPREGDEEIAEEEAVCKFCFDILKEENILKTECGCGNALIHEECAANQSRVRGNTCESCGQEVRSFPVTLLRGLGSAQRMDTQESKKKSWITRLIRFWKCGF